MCLRWEEAERGERQEKDYDIVLSLFVVNANLAPVVSWEKQRQVTQAKALAQTHQGSLWAAVRDFICSCLFFFPVWRVLLPFFFTVKSWR